MITTCFSLYMSVYAFLLLNLLFLCENYATTNSIDHSYVNILKSDLCSIFNAPSLEALLQTLSAHKYERNVQTVMQYVNISCGNCSLNNILWTVCVREISNYICVCKSTIFSFRDRRGRKFYSRKYSSPNGLNLRVLFFWKISDKRF